MAVRNGLDQQYLGKPHCQERSAEASISGLRLKDIQVWITTPAQGDVPWTESNRGNPSRRKPASTFRIRASEEWSEARLRWTTADSSYV